MSKTASSRENSKNFWLWVVVSALFFALLIVGWLYGDTASAQQEIAQKVKLALNIKGDLEVSAVEDYPGNVPVKDVTGKLDDRIVQLTKPGYFAVRDVSTGEHLITFESKAYETTTEKVIIKKGINTYSYKLSLSPVEAAERWMKIKQADNYKATYAFIHPDDKKWINQKGYVRFKADAKKTLGMTIKSYSIHSPKLLTTWRHRKTGKEYINVVAMRADVTLEAKDLGTMQRSWNIYAQKVDGRWMFFSVD